MTTKVLQQEFEADINELLNLHELHISGELETAVQAGPEKDTEIEELDDWTEGTEEFAQFTEEQLCQKLGIDPKTKKIPGFNEREDPDGLHDPWKEPEWFKANKDSTTELTIRWHQLIGIYKLLLNVFDKKPILLMDEVGLGKTIQTIGVLSLLNYYRIHYETHKVFPGDFGKFPIPSHPRMAHSIYQKRRRSRLASGTKIVDRITVDLWLAFLDLVAHRNGRRL